MLLAQSTRLKAGKTLSVALCGAFFASAVVLFEIFSFKVERRKIWSDRIARVSEMKTEGAH